MLIIKNEQSTLYINYKSIISLALFLVPILLPEQVLAQQSTSVYSIVLNESKLRIYGTSNVTDFECKYESDFEQDTLSHQLDIKAEGILVRGDRLPLVVDSFDCGKRAINKDFKNTLKYKEYPDINIELIEVFASNSIPDRASVAITLAGVTRQYDVRLVEEFTSDGTFKITGTQELLMTDFDLNPPRAMFGLIKVSDELLISFELIIKSGTQKPGN